MTAKVDTDVSTPIIYGRPRYLATILTVLALGVLVGALINAFTYRGVHTVSDATIIGNRAVTQRLARFEAQREADNAAHRERNEEAHACLIWLDIRILHDLGDRSVSADFVDDRPCDKYTAPGVVPSVTTTTTTVRRRPTPTTQRRRSTTTMAPKTTTTTRTTMPARPSCPTPTAGGICPTVP